MAADCTLDSFPDPLVSNDVSVSFCELCGYGYVTFDVANPFESAWMANLSVTVDLGASGLVYDATAPSPITIDGLPAPAAAPAGAGSTLTFTNLPDLAPVPGNSAGTLSVRFAVRRTTDPEGLAGTSSADRTITSTLSFDTELAGGAATDASCDVYGSASDQDVLPLREPLPVVTKRGWNYDAGQRAGGESDPVYGNNNDDVVWHIRIANNGLAGLQDLRFDDLMQSGNLVIDQVCASAGSANTIAANDGAGSAADCVAAGNTINDFVVTDPFGDMGLSFDGYEVDVNAGGSADIYLVGKITADGSCIASKTNTVSDVQWGCGVQSPAGGITATSTGTIPSDIATLITRYGDVNSALRVNRQLTGTNTAQPVGSKGTMTITLTNNTGGSVTGIHLADVLPPEYVVDPTFTPTINVTSPYGAYPGRVSTVVWTNQNVVDPLANTAPQFDLTSNGTTHPVYADQVDMLRQGDVAVVTFRVVLIESNYYDRNANLDVNPEEYPVTATDPTYQTPLSNTLTVEYDTYCAAQGHQTLTLTGNGTGNPAGTAIPANPEDLDIAVGGAVFILTNDPNQLLTLPIRLTNNGGHDAADYHAFVSFGATMEVVNAPAGCSPIAVGGSPVQPAPWKVWVDPTPIPATATVYECTSPATISPGQTVTYNFDVRKSSDPARIAIDDLSLRADVVGEITLSDGTPLWFPSPIARADGETDRANNYSMDATWARVIGFNLKKTQLGTCNENNPPSFDANGFEEVQIGEECSFRIETGGWFGFETPGFAYIAVQNIDVVDEVPDGQAYISSTDPLAESTSQITGVTLNPSGISALDEGWFDWRFNIPNAERIEVADEWFIVNTTTRLLNKPLDSRAAPNVHAADSFNVLNSTFDATFQNENTGATEQYTLDQNTVGYPNEPIRRVDVMVTEPNILMDKKVCNETLYGVGTACSNFVDLADDGDTYDSYIYRVTLTNEATSGGVTRAPAYDVISTDILDASDLIYVIPFASDGLDNDGDGLIDGADADGEGSIGDNVVNNATPAEITFSHTHSNALLKIDAGNSVTFFYRVDPDTRVAPLQQLINTVSAGYDSLEGDSGSQTVVQSATGELGGARAYSSLDATATVQIKPLQTQPKDIVALSNTPVSGGQPQPVSIGEEIEYELRTYLPVANLRSFVVQDHLPAGIGCTEAPVVDLDAPPYAAAGFFPGGRFTPTCTADTVVWDFGDQALTNAATPGSLFAFPLRFIARVENSAGNNDTDVISNGNPATVATASYLNDADTLVILNFGQNDILVSEPRIALTKSFEINTTDAGDILTLTVTAQNTGSATAYNLRVLDDLAAVGNLTYLGNVSGTDPPDNIDTTTFGANRPIFSWAPANPDFAIAPGEIKSFTFEVSVDTGIQPLKVLNNTIEAAWTSLPGSNTALNSSGSIGADGSASGMRIGSLPNSGDAINDYEAQASAAASVPAVAIAKTDLAPALPAEIGAHKNFQLDITLPEGTTSGLMVTDDLAAAGLSYVLSNNPDFDVTYSFAGIASINGQAPGEAAFNAFPADNTSGTALWDIGTVVTDTEDDTSGTPAVVPLIRINYYARINNDLATNAGGALQNSVVVNYTNGETGGQETLSDTTAAVTVIESALSIAKTGTLVTPAPIAGGSILEYVITINNTGDATAYEANVSDTLPAELSLYGGFTPTASINGAPVAAFVASPAGAPSGLLVWGRGNGDASLDVPAGGTLVLTYQAQVQVSTATTFNNEAWVDWSSLNDASGYERTGSGCPTVTAPDDYCAGPASAASSTTDNNSLTKQVLADSYVAAPSTANDATVRIGDTVTYRLTLNLGEGLTQNVRVTDGLPGGMALESLAVITPASGGDFVYTLATQPVVGATGSLVWDFGDITNLPSNDGTPVDALVIEYVARVLPDAGIAQVPSTTLTNTATLSYTIAGGTASQASSENVTLVQPLLALSKSASPAGGDSTIDAGELITYTVDVINSGAAPAYDAVVQDTLPIGVRQAGITMTGMTLVSAGTVLPLLDPVYDPATGSATWDLDTGVADAYTIPAGETLRIVYTVQADANLSAGLALSNAVSATRYHSFDDEAAPSPGTVIGARQIYGPTNTASSTLNSPAPVALLKETTQASASLGEQFVYRITVPATPQTTALSDVRIIDDLTASAAELSVVGISKISGSQPWTPVNTGDAKHLVIEDTTVGIDIPAGEQAVIEITVVLDDSASNASGLVFNNTADYTYNQVNADAATQTAGLPGTSADMTVAGPDSVTLQKSGPPTMRYGVPETFTLNVQNTGTAPAWDLTLSDKLPNPSPGGMCDAAPTSISARIFQADGVTPVSPVLVPGSDYTVTFSAEPDCTLTLTMQTPAAAIGAGERLIVSYDAILDADSVGGTTLINIAAATQWFSADTSGTGASGAVHTYTGTLGDGTVGTLDEQDAHSLSTESPVLVFQKSVVNVSSGQNPGASAQPGDILRYTIHLENISPVELPSFSVVDELDALNASPMFAPASLSLVSVPVGADSSNTDANGGASGTGLLDIRDLRLDAQGGATASLDIVFEVTLAPVITNGAVVLNQAHLSSFGIAIGDSDDPNVNGADDPNVAGDEEPTQTVISSSPAFEVWKISTDLTGDPAELVAGDTLRYTLTVKNIGTESAVNATLRDQLPANTSYVAGSTTLNGAPLADPSPGVLPLQGGILINAPEDATPGAMRADASATTANVATITFDVTINADVINGTVIANQGALTADGENSGAVPEEPSDDPATAVLDDPTRDVVGNLPLLDAQKIVALQNDIDGDGLVDPDDTLRYTITLTNFGPNPATGISLVDAVPADTAYVPDSTSLNGSPVGQPDGGISPLAGGIAVNSPGAGAGVIAAGQSAVVIFDVQVNSGTPVGTIISNQGVVSSNELADEPTDADGIDSNGDQPTNVVVGDVQQLAITKEVFVVGGGAAEAGDEVEYVIRVTNFSSLPATDVVITDNLDLPVAGQLTYVAGSATLNGSSAGVSFAAPVLSADYAAVYGVLPSGATAVLRFRALIDTALAIGTTVTNIAQVQWNAASQSASASVSFDVGGTPGVAVLTGQAWHDANFDLVPGGSERPLAAWSVEVYRNSSLLDTVLTDANGLYRISGLAPNDTTSDQYSLRFRAPGHGASTAMLGYADSGFTNGLQSISAISVGSGSINQNLNLPIAPNGVVYDSLQRIPVAGATVTLLDASGQQPLPASCFDDPVQQGQLTLSNGYYRFDSNFSDPACPAGSGYLIAIVPPANDYEANASVVIPPQSDAATPAFSVPACLGSANDAIPATANHCEAVALESAPPSSIVAGSAGTAYHLHLLLDNNLVPGESQLFNNHIPLDPVLDDAVAITKTSAKVNVSRGEMVPYTITVNNTYVLALGGVGIVDTFPPGFKYVKGSSRFDGEPLEPAVSDSQLRWDNIDIASGETHTIKLLFIVGAGVSEGDYVNRAQVVNAITGGVASGEARATVRVVPDPTFDCSDVIGKVFDDRNLNGVQDEGEAGLPGARLVSARGLIVTSDQHGRFHITCAVVPDENRGSNYILKLDDRSLPSGYRVTSENPRVLRVTRGKMIKFNFGATVHRVVRLDVADGVFEPDSTSMRDQWRPRIELLLNEMKKAPSQLRLSYLADVEDEGLVEKRMKELKKMISKQWDALNAYRLTIESEVYWRRGAPPKRLGALD